MYYTLASKDHRCVVSLGHAILFALICLSLHSELNIVSYLHFVSRKVPRFADTARTTCTRQQRLLVASAYGEP